MGLVGVRVGLAVGTDVGDAVVGVLVGAAVVGVLVGAASRNQRQQQIRRGRSKMAHQHSEHGVGSSCLPLAV